MNKIGYALLLLNLLRAGDVCLKSDKVFADVKVYVVDDKYKADLRVYITDNYFEGNGNDAIWRFTTIGFGESSIAFTTYEYEADIKVYFVEHAHESGWTRKILTNTRHKLKGAFK